MKKLVYNPLKLNKWRPCFLRGNILQQLMHILESTEKDQNFPVKNLVNL